MDLTVIQRLLVLGLLPREGDLTTVRIVRQLREDLSFSEEEHKALQFKTDEKTGGINWTQVDLVKTIEFGPKATELITKQLRELDSTKKLTTEFLPIWDLFIKD